MIPCKDCITLVMCKLKFKERPFQPYTSSVTLITNCIILSTYLQQRRGYMENRPEYKTEHDRIIDFFNKGDK